MKIKYIITVILIAMLYSCGTKKSAVSKEELIKHVNAYVSTVNNNQNLKKEVTEGALTDAEGFNDIGTFKYTVFYDETTKELFKIENIEKTDKTIQETYYFKNNDFVFVKFNKLIDGEKKLYNSPIKDGKTESLNFYGNKAKRFQKAFEKSH